MLKIKNITKTYGDKKILNNVSLDIEKGEIAVMLGGSGVGKSTLLRILNNLENIDNGCVTLDGTECDLAQVNKEHTIGMVFQSFNLFEHLTVLENITLALIKATNKTERQANEIALKLLERYDLGDKVDKFVSQLSGGQKQRLAIARTLALKPKVICMDEPTSALDPLLTTHVANNIQELADQGYMILVATHDVALIEKIKCTIYLMRSGDIVESATSHEFLQNKNAYPLISTFVSGTIE